MGTLRIEAIDALLPQTQCARCGYPDCHAYATAISSNNASYDQCPPGGQAGVQRLAKFLGKPEIPLNPEYGTENPRTSAVIDERRCIGCTLCIQACPVDAIMGSAKRMHTVLTACCTGCDLCLAPCPVDCIDMIALGDLSENGNDAAAQMLDLSTDDIAVVARRRYEIHKSRYDQDRDETVQRLNAKSGTGSQIQAASSDQTEKPAPVLASQSESSGRKRAIITAALMRARARRVESERARRKSR
jgi:electron transport complex protein RnfB